MSNSDERDVKWKRRSDWDSKKLRIVQRKIRQWDAEVSALADRLDAIEIGASVNVTGGKMLERSIGYFEVFLSSVRTEIGKLDMGEL